MRHLPVRYGILLLTAVSLGAQQPSTAALKSALTFHAGFDGTPDASHALGDRRLYTAPDYKSLGGARPGLEGADIEIVAGAGKFGDALRFRSKNTKAVHFKAARNVEFNPKDWSGTISFWLRLNPDRELEPGFCDPIQLTDKAYNDSAIWVDFTKDEKPRHFRLGVFGDLKSWNPKNIPADKDPNFTKRLVVVSKPPFTADRWVHVAITHQALGSGRGWARLYLDGKMQGEAQEIREPFVWDISQATIRLGVNYVGLFDDLAVFNRPLSPDEIARLNGLKKGAAEIYR